MAIHKKHAEGLAAARLLLQSAEAVELPPAEINEAGITLEREEFRPHLEELLVELRDGIKVSPVPMMNTDTMFVVHADTRSFWVRLWHTDETRTVIDRLHVTSCLPLMRHINIHSLAVENTDEEE
jgi:hypothetical protein